jgi:hypothetical protein
MKEREKGKEKREIRRGVERWYVTNFGPRREVGPRADAELIPFPNLLRPSVISKNRHYFLMQVSQTPCRCSLASNYEHRQRKLEAIICYARNRLISTIKKSITVIKAMLNELCNFNRCQFHLFPQRVRPTWIACIEPIVFALMWKSQIQPRRLHACRRITA